MALEKFPSGGHPLPILCKNFFSLSPQAELISNVSNRVTWQAIKVSTWLRIKNSKK